VVDVHTLYARYDWGRVARTILDAHAEARAGRAVGLVRSAA
jgi:hypothetical protein